jgi:hypothetical protein
MKPIAVLTLLAAAPLLAQTELPSGAGQDSRARIEAKLLLTREAMKAALGTDPGEGVIILEVKYTPSRPGKYYLDHDEFLLRADNDGQRARPLFPSQLAGSSVMVVGSRGGTQGQVGTEQRRVPYGIPGSGPPMTLPGSQPPVVGSSTADNSEATSSIEEGKTTPEQARLLKLLTEKRLPEGELEGPVSGLLYFTFDGKHKVKHFEFVYRKSPPRISVRFVEPKKK